MSKRPSDSSDLGPSASRARVEDPALAAVLAATMEKVLLSEISTDVHFIVGDPQKGNVERIPAIVAILCAASDVFKAMFVGEFERPTEVDVPDAEPDAFKIVLRYVYTGEILLNMDDSIGVLYLAKKYMLQPLIDHTARYITERMTPENVCLLLDCADVLGEINEKCWDLIDSKTTEVIHSDTFLQLTAQQLFDVVKRNTLCVEEVKLYERAIGDNVDPTPAAIRDVLGDALFGIRFPVMELKQFSSQVVKSGVLTDGEVVEVHQWHSIQDRPTSFACESRAHGRIRLKLDLRALVDGSLASPHSSAAHKIGGMSWSTDARRVASGSLIEAWSVGLYLRCHGLPGNQQWRRDAYAVMRVVAQVPGVDGIFRIAGSTFKPSVMDWGFPQFASCDHLLYADHGFLIENKYVEVIIDVFAKDCAPPTVVALCNSAPLFD